MMSNRRHNTSQTQAYLRNQVFSASPGQLRLMLYDGALRFCRKARAALERQQFETSYDAILRAQKIVLELSASLRHDENPQICGKLASLYNYIYRQLIEASTQRQIAPLDEAINHLDYDRETWRLLMDQEDQQPRSASTGGVEQLA